MIRMYASTRRDHRPLEKERNVACPCFVCTRALRSRVANPLKHCISIENIVLSVLGLGAARRIPAVSLMIRAGHHILGVPFNLLPNIIRPGRGNF
jgi:hypothetical protein